MATNDKGLNRGGIGGQEGELGEESKDLDRNATQGPTKPGSPKQRNTNPQQQRGGLRREPDLEGAEKKTGHEVD
jgi:hypothetical protein